MTTAAWDGNILAADRQAGCGTLKFQLPKWSKLYNIAEADGRHRYYAAFAGNLCDVQKACRWLSAGGEKPKIDKDEGISCILVDANGQGWFMDECLEMWKILAPHAIGSGREFALGAMKCGKTAEEAVLIASDLDIYTGFGVDFVKLSNAGVPPC